MERRNIISNQGKKTLNLYENIVSIINDILEWAGHGVQVELNRETDRAVTTKPRQIEQEGMQDETEKFAVMTLKSRRLGTDD